MLSHHFQCNSDIGWILSLFWQLASHWLQTLTECHLLPEPCHFCSPAPRPSRIPTRKPRKWYISSSTIQPGPREVHKLKHILLWGVPSAGETTRETGLKGVTPTPRRVTGKKPSPVAGTPQKCPSHKVMPLHPPGRLHTHLAWPPGLLWSWHLPGGHWKLLVTQDLSTGH